MSNLIQIDPPNQSILTTRTVAATSIRTIRLNQTNGSICCVMPLSKKITIYGQSPHNTNLPPVSITTVNNYGSFITPMDAVYDPVYDILWVLDTGADLVLGLDSAQQIKYRVNIRMPVTVMVDGNNGGIVVRHFTSMTHGRMTWISATGNIQKSINYDDTFPLSSFALTDLNDENMYWLPMPSQMAYDVARSRLWWLANNIIYMADTYNAEVVSYDVLEAEQVEDVRALDVDMVTGNVLLGCTPANNRGYYKYNVLLVVNKDNNAVLRKSKIGEVPLDISTSLTSMTSLSSLSSANEYNVFRERIYAILLDQSQQGLIPVTCQTSQVSKPSQEITIPFTRVPSLNVSAIVPDTGGLSAFVPNNSAANSYVPYDNSALYHAINPLYVDVIASNASGYLQASLAQGIVSGYNTEQNVYATPRFSWDMQVFVPVEKTGETPETTPTTDTKKPEILQYTTSMVGINSQKIFQVAMNAEKSKALATTTLAFVPTGMATYGSRLYLSSNSDFYCYSVDTYLTGKSTYTSTINLIQQWVNPQNAKVVCRHNNEIWGVTDTQVIKFNEAFEVAQIFYGAKQPQKVMWSSYHQTYFVSTTTTLYSIRGDNLLEIYWIKGGTLVDFSVASNGNLAMLWRMSDHDILRVVNHDARQIINNLSCAVNSLDRVVFDDKSVVYVWQTIGSTVNAETQKYIYKGNIIYGTNTLLTSAVNAQVLSPVTDTTNADVTIGLLTPLKNQGFIYGDTVDIKWTSNKSTGDKISLELLKDGELYYVIENSVENSGDYKWIVPSTLEGSTKYTIRATWLSLNPNTANVSVSPVFAIAATASALGQTPSVSPVVTNMGWDGKSQNIIMVWSSGVMGYFNIKTTAFYGLFDVGAKQFIDAAPMNAIPYLYDNFSKVRVFVGSAPRLNDKWDSGEVATTLSSIYYGGGNNLVGGNTYYVNIQVYSAVWGWSNIQTQTFTMPIG